MNIRELKEKLAEFSDDHTVLLADVKNYDFKEIEDISELFRDSDSKDLRDENGPGIEADCVLWPSDE